MITVFFQGKMTGIEKVKFDVFQIPPVGAWVAPAVVTTGPTAYLLKRLTTLPITVVLVGAVS